VDVRAVVFNEKDQILLIQEKVDALWAMPGGWSDISYSPAEVAEKECFEEAGMKVKATRFWRSWTNKNKICRPLSSMSIKFICFVKN